MAMLHRAAALVSSVALSSGWLGCDRRHENDSHDRVVAAQAAPPAPREQQVSLPLRPRPPELPRAELDRGDLPLENALEGEAHGETCSKGWTVPARGSPLRKAALDMIRERRSERFVVVEMRYFVGPEDAEVIGPSREVERWYVKAYSVARHSRRQRWLVRRAAVGSGVDAVAPFDSTGYGPGIWQRPDAVDESVSDPFQRPCDRTGEKCLGLPREVLGCLRGT
ncbi:MAG: hypothetical protein ABI895_09455 [Deltaproteobacteria bacterium]